MPRSFLRPGRDCMPGTRLRPRLGAAGPSVCSRMWLELERTGDASPHIGSAPSSSTARGNISSRERTGVCTLCSGSPKSGSPHHCPRAEQNWTPEPNHATTLPSSSAQRTHRGTGVTGSGPQTPNRIYSLSVTDHLSHFSAGDPRQKKVGRFSQKDPGSFWKTPQMNAAWPSMRAFTLS